MTPSTWVVTHCHPNGDPSSQTHHRNKVRSRDLQWVELLMIPDSQPITRGKQELYSSSQFHPSQHARPRPTVSTNDHSSDLRRNSRVMGCDNPGHPTSRVALRPM
ncbi:hypothetical protein TIFTF001_002143 [Ficus carica]|uniref:Uncharacterized protein n=1 Tax=Ficus carica TaxID=3494 RepID=A0AA88CRM2_FICCA|nr:hypothetical protein TIFTF001_002143 [Ficus carica]